MYNIGIIGASLRAKCLVDILKKNHKNFKIICVYDDIKEIADNTENGTNDFDFFWKNKYDLVMIMSINYKHIDHIEECHKNNVNIFCEKPIITSIKQYYKIKKMGLISNDKLFLTGFVLRYSPFFKKIKQLLHLIGPIKTVMACDVQNYSHGSHIFKCWRRYKEYSGGHVVEKTIHIIDLLNWYLESCPKEVFAFGGNDFWNKENTKYRDMLKQKDNKIFDYFYDYEKVDPFEIDKNNEDNIVCNIKYNNDVKVSLTLVTFAPNSKRTFTFYGMKGVLEASWDLKIPKIKLIRDNIGIKINKSKPCKIEKFVFNNTSCHGGGDDIMISELTKSIKNNSDMKVSITEAFKSNNTCIAIMKSMESGKKEKVIL